MSDSPVGRPFSPPELPPYLQSVYDLKPIVGIPNDDEVIGIHAVMRMAQKAVDIPGTGDPVLLAQLAEHLFNVQMAIHRSKYPDRTAQGNTTYTPPTLPSHITVQLKPVVNAPSDEEIITVQDAIRSYNQFANAPSLFDTRVNMELSQHLFDIQMARYTQRMKQGDTIPVPRTPSSSSTRTINQASDMVEEGQSTNNIGTGSSAIRSNDPTMLISKLDAPTPSQPAIHLAEQANQLAERCNLLIERSNQIAERANQLVERSNQPVEPPTTLVEKFTELFGRLNEHLEKSNQLAEVATKPVEKLGEVLGNINRVLVRIQHAIVRNHKGNTYQAADCLVNEKGTTPGQSSETDYASYEWLTNKFGGETECEFPVTIEGVRHLLHIDNTRLASFLRFYDIDPGFWGNEISPALTEERDLAARTLLGRYLSSCLG